VHETSGSSFAPSPRAAGAPTFRGDFAAARMPALTGDVTSSAGSVQRRSRPRRHQRQGRPDASLRTKCTRDQYGELAETARRSRYRRSVRSVPSLMDLQRIANRPRNPDCTWQGQFHVAQRAAGRVHLLTSSLRSFSDPVRRALPGGRLSFSLQIEHARRRTSVRRTKYAFQAFSRRRTRTPRPGDRETTS